MSMHPIFLSNRHENVTELTQVPDNVRKPK